MIGADKYVSCATDIYVSPLAMFVSHTTEKAEHSYAKRFMF